MDWITGFVAGVAASFAAMNRFADWVNRQLDEAIRREESALENMKRVTKILEDVRK